MGSECLWGFSTQGPCLVQYPNIRSRHSPSPNSLQQTSLENKQFKIPINNEKNKILNNNSKINSEEAKEDTISGGSTITSSLTSRIQSELKKLFNYS